MISFDHDEQMRCRHNSDEIAVAMFDRIGEACLVPIATVSAPLTLIDRRQFDYSDLDHWIAQMDQAIRHARRTLSALAQPTRENASVSNEPLDTRLPACSLDIPADRDHQNEPPAPVPG